MTKASRILIAESGSGYGGSAKYLASLLPFLDRKRFDVSVISYGDGPFIQRIARQGEVVRFEASWRFPWLENVILGGPQLLFSVPRIAIWLRRQGFRLIHLNNEILSHLPLLVASKIAGCKVLCHLHGWRRFTRLERLAVGLVDEFITISRAGAEFFSEELGGRQVVGIPNGLSVNGEIDDLDKKRISERKKLRIEEDAMVVTIIGRLVPWKGHEVYLRALAKVMKTNQKVEGIILGSDSSKDQQYLKRLQSLAEELGIKPHVHFLAWQEDVWPVYAASDVVVHASTEPEPFGLVILEAMFAKKPVIATRGGGVTDMVVEQETGLLVERNNVDELASAISRLALSPMLADQFAVAGKGRAHELFTMERNADQVVALYHRLLRRPS